MIFTELEMKHFSFIFLLLIFFPGCAGYYTYTPPGSPLPGKNSIVVNEPKEVIWKKMVPKLGKRFFTINNLDKSSGLVNITYRGDPEAYVDCGSTESVVKNIRGKRMYSFPVSRANQEFEALIGTQLFIVTRKMVLESKVNLIFEDMGENKTKITANANYILTNTQTNRQISAIIETNEKGTIDAHPEEVSESINFNSNGSASFQTSITSTKCQPTGKYEKDVLSLVQ